MILRSKQHKDTWIVTTNEVGGSVQIDAIGGVLTISTDQKVVELTPEDMLNVATAAEEAIACLSS